ncbi:HupE/UreJ family protein [Patiriisocius marinus]|uniref:HupE/UreJ family protein n=1 Tax=Patiriisocius marinus TaxID=1397112 RepID=UPI00232E5CD4|nr:HupE/UreJ family protein [Patiriisocius marinus]
MNDFIFYFKQGLDHILDIDGIDHMLFILAMVVFFDIKQWKKLLILVTAFTLGHSITLALSSFNIVQIDSSLVELLIPITIIITCFNNIIKTRKEQRTNYVFLYGLVLFFGLIHGLAFSNFLKMSLFESDSILLPLLGFNLGIEIGQLLIVTVFMILVTLILKTTSAIRHQHITIVVSVIIMLVSLYLLQGLLLD